jgi:uncharacterized protein (TIGR03435 family)
MTLFFQRIGSALLLVSAIATASADCQTTPPLAFEVATVKPANPNGSIIGIFTYPGGKIQATQFTLKMLVQEAFKAGPDQIAGGPAWFNSDRFDIVAKPSDDSAAAKLNPASPKTPLNDDQRQMLQTLLADRFNLKFHRASKEGPVYVLTRGDKPLKLDATKDPQELPWMGGIEGGAISWPTGIAGKNISMPQLATRLIRYMGTPVLDQTNITGSFDFSSPTGESAESDTPIRVAIIESLRDIGLKLTAAKGPVETLVIDHAEKPSAN